MSGKLVALICYFILLAPMHLCRAQLKFEHFESDAGSDVISTIFRDRDGYLWVGNSELGLVRHNSYESESFNYSQNDTTSLSSNNVQNIFEDSFGRLWIGTDNGLNRYLRRSNSFKRYYNNPSDTTSLHGNTVYHIYEDKQHNVWMITNNGPNKYIPEIDGFKRYNQSSKILADFVANAMIQDHDGHYWIASLEPGLWLFDPVKDTVSFFGHEPEIANIKKLRHLLLDDENKIWVSSRGNGIYIFDPITKNYTTIPINGDGTGLNSNFTTDIKEWTNYILIGVDQGGINLYDKNTKKFSYIKGKNELSSDGIYCFNIDQEGIIWVGTSRGGINYYNPNKYLFKTYTSGGCVQPGSLSYNIVGCFYEDTNGDIWVGTDGGGIDILKYNTNTFVNFDEIIKTPASNYDIKVIRSISRDKNGCLWIATWNTGIWKYDPKSKIVVKEKFGHAPKKLRTTPFWSLYIDKKNRFWITLVEGDIFLLDNNISLIAHFFDNQSKLHRSIPKIHEQNGQIYVSTKIGIYTYNEDENKLDQFSAPDYNIADLRIGQSKIYAITGDKAFIISRQDGAIIDSLTIPNILFLSLEIANNDHIWLSSQDGLFEYNPKTKTLYNYNKSDGLQDDKFFSQSSYKTSGGELLFGGLHGFNLFVPENIRINAIPPHIHIEKMKIVDNPIPLSILEYPKSSPPVLNLNWNDRMLTISFVGINFTSPQKNQYMYKLEGFDKDWISTPASHRSATYTNLPPGDYTFSVKASNNSGVWAKEAAHLNIHVKPPFWKEPWFMFSMASLTVIFIIIYVERGKNKLRKDKEILREKVDERTKIIQSQNEELKAQNEVLHEQRDVIYDLNKNLEKKVKQKTSELTITIQELNKTVSELDRFIYSTSHELSAPMKSVLGLVNIAKQDLDGDMGLYLQHIEKSILKQEDVIKALVNFTRNSRDEVKIDTLNLWDIITNSIDELKYINGYNNIEFKVDIDKNMKIKADFIRLKMIINNLLINAIKYKDTKKNNNWIKVSSKVQPNKILLNVSDNGIGINKEYLHQIFDMFFRATESSTGTGLGLYIVMESIKKLNGEIKVKSELNIGTEFTLIFPLYN